MSTPTLTNEELVQKFNPANAANITAEDVEIMHNLTTEQLDVLAAAYPNQPNRKPYIRLYDKNLKENKQLYQLSTWQNLRNLRKFSNKTNLIPWEFFAVNAGAMVKPIAKGAQVPAGAKQPARKVVVDLTAKEAAAELSKNVENQKSEKPKPETTKPAKAATTAKPTGKAGNKKAEAPVVENPPAEQAGGEIPADQQFTGAE